MNFSPTSTTPPGGDTPSPRPPAPADPLGLPPSARPGRPRSSGKKVVLAGAALVAAAGGVIFLGGRPFRPMMSALFAGSKTDVITYLVRPANLPVVVNEKGSLESSKNEDAYCQVEGQTTIIKIVPEGTRVKKGELVCELDSAALTDQLTSQMITTKGAEAAHQNAKLTREVAEIAVTEYIEGIFKQDMESAQIAIALAQADRKRSEDRLEWSARMLQKGYISAGAKLSEQLSLQRAIFSEEEAQTKKHVLEKYTKGKTIKELKSEVEKARSDELAKEATWNLEKTKEAKLRRQIKNCNIFAPNDGLVVYANDPNRFGGQQTPQVEEGATVRERQKIFSLPDITRMQVNTKVHESMIDRITPGLRARIKVDAFPDSTLTGVVEDIAPLPDPSSFFSSDVKVYTTHVAIEKGLPGLRPGMTAQVEILVTELDDVLSVPVTAVVQYKNKDHLAVKTADGFDWRDVTLGISNDRLVEVKKGLDSGDRVALNAVALMTEEERRAAFGSSSKDATKKDWGQAKAKVGQAPVPVVPPGAAAGKDGADKAKAKAKGKGARGGAMSKMDPATKAKLLSASPEEQRQMLIDRGVPADRVDMILDRMKNGGGGPGGPPGGGGFGGPGGGGGGGFGGPGGGGNRP